MRKALLLIIIAACAATAQEGWVIPFAVGYRPDIAGFNAEFAAHDLPEAAVNHYGWGIEIRSLVGNLLVGPLYMRAWDDAETEEFHLRTDASAVLGEVGYKIAPLSFLTLVPMVGVGGLSQTFSIRSLTGDIGLDSLLRAPAQNAAIQSGMKLAGMAALELGLAATIGDARYGLALRGGYIYSPADPGWHLSNGSRIAGAPDGHLGGPFASLGLMLLPAAQTQSTGP